MKAVKSIISILLIIALAIGLYPVTAEATQNVEHGNEAMTGDCTVSATGGNSLGTYLAQEIEEQQLEEETKEDASYISNVEIQGHEAIVTLYTETDCTVVVELYSDYGDSLLASGSVSVAAGTESVTVDLSTTHRAQFPTYFGLEAYLLDENGEKIESSEHATSLFTEELQELLASTIYDYSEYADDRIINLDENEETNFGVLNEDVIVITPKENTNTIASVDEEHGRYVFTNIDEQISTLQPGDVFSYLYNGTDILMTKVFRIMIDGTTATIFSDDAELSTFFDYLKIETEGDLGDAEITPDMLADGVTFVEDRPSTRFLDYSGDISSSQSLAINVTEKIGGVKVEATGMFKASYKFVYYLSLTEVEVEYSMTKTLTLSASVSGKLDMAEIPLTRVPLCISPLPGLYIEFTPKLCFQLSAKITISISLEKKTGFSLTKRLFRGWKKESINETKKKSATCEMEGTIYVGIVIEPKIVLISKSILSLSIKLSVGIEYSIKIQRVLADCEGVIMKKLTLKAKLDVTLSVLDTFSFSANILTLSFGLGLPTSIEVYNRHDYSDSGGRICSKCGKEYPLTKDTTCSGRYAVPHNSKEYCYQYPYKYGSSIATLQNCYVYVDYSVKNSKGECWYHLDTGAFVRGTELTRDLSAVNPSLGLSANSISYYCGQAPGNLVVSSNFEITGISATLNGSSLGKIKPNAKSVNLKKTDLFKSNKWKNLAIGSYTLRLTVNFANDTSQSRTVSVTVEHTPVAAPSISTADTYNGKTVTIRNNETGGTMTYTYSGGTFTTSNRTVSFDIASSQTVTAYASASDGYRSAKTSKSYVVNKLDLPKISIDYISTGATISIGSADQAVTYYSVNGGAEQTYAGPFHVAQSGTVTAHAVMLGSAASDTGTATVTLTAPSTPNPIAFQSDSMVAEGKSVSVSWQNDKRADHYVARLYSGDTLIEEKTPEGTVTSFVLPEAGLYEIKVQAINDFLGNSEESAGVVFEAKAPSLVQFLDDDGSVLSAYHIPYGDYLGKEKSPSHRGYYFSGWLPRNDYYTFPIYTDMNFTATYEKIEYDVSFYDVDGTKIGDTQKIRYMESATAPNYTNLIPTGYAFTGWAVMEASESDSLCDYTHVDANMKFQAVIHWANDELPVFVTVNSAVADPVEGAPCYTVAATLTGWPDKTSDVYLCVALKNQDPETGIWKTVYAERKQIKLFANTTSEETMQLFYSGIASTAEVFVLARKSDGTTGSAYSEVKSLPVTFNTLWTEWSDWSTEAPAEAEGRTIEQKTEYRYMDKRTTTSSNDTLDGWTLYDTTTSWGSWSEWSSWSDTAVTASDATEVETKTVLVKDAYKTYTYKTYWSKNSSQSQKWTHFCPTCAHNLYGGTWNEKTTTQNSRATVKSLGQRCSHKGTFDYYYVAADGWGYYYETVKNYPATYKTQYRYRTRSEVTTYHFYQWPTEWSEWSEVAVNATSDRQVETRTVYRYQDEIHEYSTGAAAEDISGTAYHFAGTIDSDEDLTGKVATIMVYKSKNMDPNQYQMQYVGQTTILADNAYDISFKTIDEPSPESGNYVVCLGMQGTTGLIDVAIIEAPREAFTVRYLNEDGSVISEQTVLEGDNAVVPEPPAVQGSQFVGWSDRGTNIYRNVDIYAQYVKNQYVVVFVDWINQTIAFQTYNYGDEIRTEVAPTAEGYTFIGWDALLAGNTTVTENTVVSAVYEADAFTVRFLDAEGEPVDIQTVEYMQAAELPAAPAAQEDMLFLGWSTEFEWWKVTEDIDVEPIFVYEETAETPQTNYGTAFAGEDISLELTAEEDAAIYYTLDGSEPGALSMEYTEPIELTDESVTVRAVAVAPRKNVSPVLNFVFTAQNEFGYEDDGVRTEIETVEAEAIEGQRILLKVSGENTTNLSSFRIAIDGDRGVFYPVTDENGNYLAEAGAAFANGELVCEATDTGWLIYWNGEPTRNADNTLFTILLATTDDTAEDSYPLTAYVCEDYMLDANGEHVEDAAQALTLEREVVTCEEHAYAAMTNTATCTEAGTATYVCYRCGATYTGASEALGHDFVAQTTTATCTEAGQKTLKCSRCGVEETEAMGAIGHDYTLSEVTATCTEAGENVYTCTRCGDVITEEAEALGHSYIKTDYCESTCTQDGYAVFTCSVCGDTVTDVLEAQHLYELDSIEDETCTEDGRMIYICTRCGEENVVAIPAAGHTAEEIEAVAATCTEAGLTAGSYCVICGETLQEQEEVPATGHTYTSETVAATCSTDGAVVYTCTECGDTYSEPIGKAHHYVDGACEFCGLPEEHSGTIDGTDCTWQIISDNYDSVALVIHGTMPDFTAAADVPWSGCASLITSVTLCDDTPIGSYAFYDCSRLTAISGDVEIPTVGKFAFYRNSALKQVVLNGTGLIDRNAFHSCTSLESVLIQAEGLTGSAGIGSAAFRNCTSLSSIKFCITGDCAYSIGSLAFAGCTALQTTILPAQTTEIALSAFMGADLRDVYIFSKTAVLGDEENTLGTPGTTTIHGFTGSTAQTYATDWGYTFAALTGCTGGRHDYAQTVVQAATCIAAGTMRYTCTYCGDTFDEPIPISEEHVIGQNDICSVCNAEIHTGTCGDDLVWTVNCSTGVLKITGTGAMPDWIDGFDTQADDYNPENCAPWFDFWDFIYTVIIGDDVTSIGAHAFDRYDYMTNVVIPDSVTSIGEHAFNDCSGLTEVTIPDSVTSIGNYAFYGCTGLTNVAICNAVTSIGSYAFAKCSGLVNVTIPSSVTDIGTCAFYDCTGLVNVTIQQGVTSIGKRAFWSCTGLKSITIPVSVTSIGALALYETNALEHVYYAGTPGHWDYLADGNVYTQANVHFYVTDVSTHWSVSQTAEGDACAAGTITYTCPCGYTKTEEGPENHNWVLTNTVSPTCAADGYDLETCSVCGATRNTNFVDRLAHTYVLQHNSASCTEAGTAYYVCSICGAEHTEASAAIGHRLVTAASQTASCTEDGWLHRYCDVCYEQVSQTVSALGHDLVSVPEVPATCTASGTSASVYCGRPGCGEVITAQETLPALGHTWGDEEVITYPTCTERGESSYTCLVCEATKTEITPMTEHMEGVMPEVLPNCTNSGLTEGTHCVICGAILVEREVVPATGHMPVEDEAMPATCTQDGFTAGSHCAICDTILVAQETIPAFGHTLNVAEGHEASCTDTGVSWSAYCSTCGKYIVKAKTIAALPHHEAEPVTENDTPATCTAAGSFDSVVYCANCNTEVRRETVEVAALGHNYAFTDALAPTCTEVGYTMGCVCSRCSSAAIAPQEIPALGHELVADAAVPATCTENGLTAGEHCARCGEVTTPQDVIPAGGHNFVNGVCTVCGKSEAAPDIYSASLLLNEDIHVVYAATIPAACKDPYMTFRYNGETYTVTEYSVNSDGKYLFIFDEVTPQCMGDSITAVLHAQVNEEDVTDTVTGYSVRQYCVNQLNRNPADSELKTLLSDLLTYGAAAQIYTGYKTRDLVTDGLELTPSEFAAISGKTVSFTGTADSKCDWTAAGLVLGNSVAMRFAFAANDVNGLSVVVTVNGREETFTAFDFVADGEGRYHVDFRGIEATEFDDTVSATFYRNGGAVGRTVNYSVNAYVCTAQDSSNTSLKTLVRALYNYGASAKIYSAAN